MSKPVSSYCPVACIHSVSLPLFSTHGALAKCTHTSERLHFIVSSIGSWWRAWKAYIHTYTHANTYWKYVMLEKSLWLWFMLHLASHMSHFGSHPVFWTAAGAFCAHATAVGQRPFLLCQEKENDVMGCAPNRFGIAWVPFNFCFCLLKKWSGESPSWRS